MRDYESCRRYSRAVADYAIEGRDGVSVFEDGRLSIPLPIHFARMPRRHDCTNIDMLMKADFIGFSRAI